MLTTAAGAGAECWVVKTAPTAALLGAESCAVGAAELPQGAPPPQSFQGCRETRYCETIYLFFGY